MKFSQMVYVRPQLGEMKKQLKELTLRLEEAEDYESAKKAFLEKETVEKHISTLRSLAHIRHTIDTKDEFYEREEQFWNESLAVVVQDKKEWDNAILKSPFRPAFLKNYCRRMFINNEI